MKKISVLLMAMCLFFTGMAQEKNLKALVADGNKAYVDFVDVKGNIPQAKIKKHPPIRPPKRHWAVLFF